MDHVVPEPVLCGFDSRGSSVCYQRSLTVAVTTVCQHVQLCVAYFIRAPDARL